MESLHSKSMCILQIIKISLSLVTYPIGVAFPSDWNPTVVVENYHCRNIRTRSDDGDPRRSTTHGWLWNPVFRLLYVALTRRVVAGAGITGRRKRFLPGLATLPRVIPTLNRSAISGHWKWRLLKPRFPRLRVRCLASPHTKLLLLPERLT